MFRLIKENNKLSFEKSFISLLLLATLLPRFDAIDNNALRWFSLTAISSIYLLKLMLDRSFRGSFSVPPYLTKVEQFFKKCIMIPIWDYLTDEEISYIADTIISFYRK